MAKLFELPSRPFVPTYGGNDSEPAESQIVVHYKPLSVEAAKKAQASVSDLEESDGIEGQEQFIFSILSHVTSIRKGDAGTRRDVDIRDTILQSLELTTEIVGAIAAGKISETDIAPFE